MARRGTTSIRAGGRILGRLAGEGKKTAVALGLIAVMALMWVRVLTGHKPSTAAAAGEPTPPATAPQELPRKVHLLELPRIPGRHDVIYRDFFTMPKRACFQPDGAARGPGTEPEVRVSGPDRVQEVVHRVAPKLKLEAVLWSEDPQTFLNNQLLRVGDKLTIKEGTDSVEFEVLRIYEDSVLVGYDGVQLTLRLAQGIEGNK